MNSLQEPLVAVSLMIRVRVITIHFSIYVFLVSQCSFYKVYQINHSSLVIYTVMSGPFHTVKTRE